MGFSGRDRFVSDAMAGSPVWLARSRLGRSDYKGRNVLFDSDMNVWLERMTGEGEIRRAELRTPNNRRTRSR